MKEFVSDILMRILYKQSPDINLTESEVELLNSLPPSESISILRSIFAQETNRQVKSRAFQAILSVHAFDSVQFLLTLLDQPITDWRSVDWRLAYCRALSRFHDPRAIAKLCAILLNDPDPDMRYTAAESLALIGDATAVPALEHAQAHDTGKDYEGFPVAHMAGEALQEIRSRIHK